MSQLIDEQIEENLRFCEELLKRNPGFVPVEEEWGGDVYKSPLQDNAVASAVTPPLSPQIDTPPVAKTPLRDSGVASAAKPPLSPKIEPLPRVAEPPSPAAESVVVIPAASGMDLLKEEPEQREHRSILRTVASFLICTVIAFLLGILITKFVANHTMVDGSSMEPALQNGDNLIVEKISYLTGKPDRFDIIVFKQNENTCYIKRVVGLPGERIQIQNGKTYVNGKPIYDAFGDGDMDDGGIASKEITLGQDEYFVLGDNRDGSEDSRNEKVGPVKAEQIEGRAWFRITPLQHFGILE